MDPGILKIMTENEDMHTQFEIMWTRKITNWHQNVVCPFLMTFSSKVNLSPPKRVLIPFCGKALELKWFYDKGFEVVGIEFVELPVQEFFQELNLTFKIRELPWGKVYETSDQHLKIYVADIYNIKIEEVGKFDIIWSRAVYTAIPIAEREKFSNIIKQLSKEKFLYLLCALQFEVDADKKDIPPRPISTEEIKKLYDNWCNIELAAEEDGYKFYPNFKSRSVYPLTESYFILTPK